MAITFTKFISQSERDLPKSCEVLRLANVDAWFHGTFLLLTLESKTNTTTPYNISCG